MKLKEIDLYITERCNLKCPFCSVQASNCSQNELDFIAIQNFILFCKDKGVTDIHITGGEPTLHKDYKDIIAFIIKQNIDVRLITNGMLLSKNDLIELRSIGLKKLMISLDGLSEFHNSVRIDGGYERVLKLIKDAVSLGFYVRVNSVVWNENLNDIPELMDVLNDLNVNVYSVFLGSPVGRAKKMTNLSVVKAQKWRMFLEELKKIHIKKKMRLKVIVEKGYVKIGEHCEHYKIRSCDSIINNTDYLSVRADGKVFPCVFFSNDIQSIGNIYDIEKMDFDKNIQYSEFYNSIVRLPMDCNGCQMADYCKGGCREFNFNQSKTNKDWRCYQDGYIPICPLIKTDLFEDKIAPCTDDLTE